MTELTMFTAPDLTADADSEPVLAGQPEPAPTGSEPAGNQVPEPVLAGNLTGSEPVPGTGSTGSEAGSGTSTELVPVLAVPARRIGLAEFLLRSLRERAAVVAANQKRHRTFWHALWAALTAQPESFTAHREHINSRAWLEDWMTGKLRTAFEWQNILFGYLIALPVKIACRGAIFAIQNIEKAAGRQYRFWLIMPILAFIIWHLVR